jgi:hypothetical protein
LGLHGVRPRGAHVGLEHSEHAGSSSYERLGEKYGEVFDLVVNRGVAWKPLQPKRFIRNGRVITIDFDVPTPPLAWDENLGTPSSRAEWAEGRGFEVSADAQPVAILSATLVGNSVELTLESDPGTAQLRVSYAISPAGGANLPAGTFGQLRDSDNFEGYAVETLEVDVMNGSDMVNLPPTDAERRAPWDLVTGAGLPVETLVREVTPGSIRVSAPWSGASGKARLRFHHNHRNYCVHFSEVLP